MSNNVKLAKRLHVIVKIPSCSPRWETGFVRCDTKRKVKTDLGSMDSKGQSVDSLMGIPETLLIPLWARAMELKMPTPIVQDPKAAEILSQLEYDFTRFEKAKFSQLGVSIRSMLLDKATECFIKSNPDSIVINLGAGLDTRHTRISTGEAIWYDLDVPEAIELRKRFFKETANNRFIAKSMFDKSWLDDINDDRKPVLIIAEGLFMYFTVDELKPLMARLARRFPNAEMLIEVQGPAIVGRGKHHDSLKKINGKPEFKWGAKDSKEITEWCQGIEFIEEWSFFDYHRDRAGLFGYIIRLPFLRPQIDPRIVHLKFESN